MMIDSSIEGCQVDSRFITIGATDNDDWQLNRRLSGGQPFYYHWSHWQWWLTAQSEAVTWTAVLLPLEPLTMMIDSSIGGCHVDSRFITIGATNNDDWQLNRRLSRGQPFYYHWSHWQWWLTAQSKAVRGTAVATNNNDWQLNWRLSGGQAVRWTAVLLSLEPLTMIDSSIEDCRVDSRCITTGATNN